ncbi:MAG: hypothetical protein JO318_17415 [Chloroflexi bacterium]|nr:hypothetical protein [Chloroflexota bacterium]
MLAYVFWHWPAPDHRAAEYEQLQADFHAALAQAHPPGFECSLVFRVDGEAPWLGGSPAYADWYLVRDSAALDPLNVAAVTGVCEQPHAKVAHAMAAGAGSLLALRGDADPNVGAARHLTWLTKPRPMPYTDFYAAVSATPAASLWRRTMVLGPNPEFALLTAAAPPALTEFTPLTLGLTPVWPKP